MKTKVSPRWLVLCERLDVLDDDLNEWRTRYASAEVPADMLPERDHLRSKIRAIELELIREMTTRIARDTGI